MKPRSGYILAVDQGTTNTKALLLSGDGTVVSQASCAVRQSYPQPGWVEQEPQELWRSVVEAAGMCLRGAGGAIPSVLAVTNQRETTVIWERSTGKPLGPAVVWQCKRTSAMCEQLERDGLEPKLRGLTGLTIDPMFSGTKMRWLVDNTENGAQRAERGEICLGTVDSWLLWNLTGGAVHACDVTNASRTQLMDLRTLSWSDELTSILGVPAKALPRILPSASFYGETFATGEIPAGLPIYALVGDSHAALFGQAGFVPGSVKATYGTGSSLMTATADRVVSERGISGTVAWQVEGSPAAYALEGNIYLTGGAVQWLGEFLGFEDPARQVAALADSVTDSGGLYFVPALAGLGAPHWDEAARGTVSGLSLKSSAGHLARASIESIAYQVRDVFDVMMSEAGLTPEVLLADGGAAGNRTLMQFQADILGVPVVRNTSSDVAAVGAAYLAGLACGLWLSLDEVKALPREQERFESQMSTAERERLYSGWRDALNRTLTGR